MTLTPDNLETLCKLAIEAATTTGQYISQARPTNIEHKDTGGSLATQVVTDIDRESQRRILEILQPSFAQFELALLTEESPDDGSRLEKDYFWCIDPIDGTLCFIEDKPGYAISIALISRDGIPQIGVVYDPVRKLLCHAIRERGAHRNFDPWQPQVHRMDGPPTIYTDHSEAVGSHFEPMARAMNANWGTYGGGVLNAMWCLENAPACYFKFAKPGTGGGCFWDFAATSCIYREVGAWSTDARGATLDLNRAQSVYLNHCGVLFASHARIARHFLALAPTLLD